MSKFDLAEVFADIHKSGSAPADKSVGFALTREQYDKYKQLQKATNRRFGKTLSQIVVSAIETTPVNKI